MPSKKTLAEPAAKREPTALGAALRALPAKRRKFALEYLACLNATEAARRAGYRTPRQEGSRLLTNADIAAAVEAGFAQSMGRHEALHRVAEIARATMADFITLEEIEYREPIDVPAFERREQLRARIAEALEQADRATGDANRDAWHAVAAKAEAEIDALPENPLELVTIEGPLRKKVLARVDLVKAEALGRLHLVKKLRQTDRGVEVELYAADDALELIGKHHRLWTDRVSLENPDGTAIGVIGIAVVPPDDG